MNRIRDPHEPQVSTTMNLYTQAIPASVSAAVEALDAQLCGTQMALRTRCDAINSPPGARFIDSVAQNDPRQMYDLSAHA
jgi:hypothetical protein